MISIADIESINKILRTKLIEQSGLDGKKILNALSVYGEDLDKLIEKAKYESYGQSDCFILFELKSRETGSNVSYTQDNKITYVRSYEFHLIIYGDSSTTLANKLVARLRSEKVLNDLQIQGIYLEQISDPLKINEYKNRSMWIRNDIDIDLSSQMEINQITVDSDFALGSIDIIK